MALISTGLWIWMAYMNRAGKNWARITGTVFFAWDTLGTLIVVFRANGTALSIMFALVTWLVGLATVMLLWNRRSSAFFRPAQAYTPYPPHPYPTDFQGW